MESNCKTLVEHFRNWPLSLPPGSNNIFTTDLDKGTESMFSELAENSKLRGMANVLKGRVKFQKDPDRLES